MSIYEIIKVTEIKNPSKFFFFSLNDPKLSHLAQQESELNRLLAQKGEIKLPAVGEICAYFHEAFNKWIRVELETVENENGAEVVTLWSLDYGISLHTDNLNNLVAVPEEYKSDLNLVQVGCLNVLPAKEIFDFNKAEKAVAKCSEWSSKAIELMENFVNYAKQLKFIVTEARENLNFGDIEARNDEDAEFSLCKMLINGKHAIASVDGKLNESLFKTCSFEFEKKIANEIEKKDFGLLKFPKIRKLEKISQSVCNLDILTNRIAVKEDKSSSSSGVDKAKSNEVEEVNNNCELLQKHMTLSKPIGEKSILEQIVQQQSTIISSSDVVRVFVHGKHLHCPLRNIDEASFSKEIHSNLHAMNFRLMYRTQSHSWPNILEGRAVFIVNSEKSGKTFSYLPAILSSILFEEGSEQPSAQGPIGIIICRSSRDVAILHKYCLKLVPREKMEIIKAFGKWKCDDTKVELMNGCDLLITTPPCFSRLAKGDVIRMFNKNRIKFLVFDGLDSMNDLFEKEIKDIIKTCTRGDRHPELNPQLIVTSTSWKEYLHGYMKLTCDPIVIIGSFVEAALYAKCKFNITKNSIFEKFMRLKSFLMTDKWQKRKTLIVVNGQSEIAYLQDFCKQFAIAFSFIDNTTPRQTLKAINESWIQEEPDDMTFLLATDEALISCTFNCVEILIHFSLPAKWTAFSRRFATMSQVFLEISPKKITNRPSTMIMLDDVNYVEIPRLIDFLKSHQVLKEIPDEINNLVQRIVESRELLKRDPSYEQIMPICSSILLFGECESFPKCKKRHVFNDIDRPVNIPTDGLIKFELVGVINPAHYSVKVLEYLPAGTKKWISCKKRIQRVEESLEQLQKMMTETCIIQTGVKTNDICAVFCAKAVKWFRCRVLEKQKTDKSNFQAIVHFIDDGQKVIVKSTDLMVLPEPLKVLDPLLTELRIVNLVPYDRDNHWDFETSFVVKKYFNNNKNNVNDYKFAEVKFTVQNVMFTETFEIRSHIEDLNIDVTQFSLKIHLLKKHFCLKDEEVAGKLKSLLKRANLYVPAETKVASEDKVLPLNVQEEKPEPRWKHLTIGSDYQVQIKQFETPDLFYVRLNDKGNNVLRKLSTRVDKCSERMPIKAIKEGDFCLIVIGDEKPKRGIITTTCNNESSKVFLLDDGETIECKKSEIFELPVSIINVMPFQAVQCRLTGIKPRFNMSEWLPRPSSAFREFVKEFSTENMFKLEVIAKRKNSYDVKIFHNESGDELSKIAIEEKFADSDKCESVKVFNDSQSVLSDESKCIEPSEKTTEELILKLLNESDGDGLNMLTDEIMKMYGFDFSRALESHAEKLKSTVKPLPNIAELNPSTRECLKLDKIKLQPALPSTLSYIHKHPKIEWRQDEILIMLTITATDSVDYSLEIDDSSLKVHIQYKDEIYEATRIQLYGAIEVEMTSHEKTGEKVIVRLLKSLTLSWPRLCEIDEPNRFITYSLESVPNLYFADSNLSSSRNARPGGDSDDGSGFLGDLSDDEILDEII